MKEETARDYWVITPFFPSAESFRGGFVYDQTQAIHEDGRYRRVLVFKPRGLFEKADDYEYGGIEVYRFPMVSLPSYLFNGCFDWLNCRLFERELRRHGLNCDQAAVVHAHTANLGALPLAVKRRNPRTLTLLQHHCPDPFLIRNGSLGRWRFNLRYRARRNLDVFSRIDIHVAISEMVKQHLYRFPEPVEQEHCPSYREALRLAAGLPKARIKKTIVLHNGVDRNVFRRADRPSASGRIFRIGCIGNFVTWKDQLCLIKAIEALDDRRGLTVSLIGTGPCRAMCEQYVADNGLSECIEFLPELNRPELAAFYNQLDLFVLPSYFEGFGCVFTEACACGVPFISCRDQGIEELIPEEDRKRWLAAPGDFRGLADRIRNFRNERYEQRLCGEIDIRHLVPEFLDQLAAMRRELI